MNSDFFKIAFRNIKRNALHSVLNIIGLSIGMACAILILLWIKNELEWDRGYKNGDDIYRTIMKVQYENGLEREFVSAPVPLASVLKAEYPEIFRSTRYGNIEMKLSNDDQIITEEVTFVDNDFFKMFGIEFLVGDTNSIFNGPYDIIITEEKAYKFFGKESPIGKSLLYKEIELTITGVIKDPPNNSSLQYGLLLPYDLTFKPEMESGMLNDWKYTFGTCFVQLNKGADYKTVESKIKNVVKYPEEMNFETSLQNLKMIHLHSARKYFNEPFRLSNIIYVQLGSLIAILILVISCINFMNMATAQSLNRFKEIGIRKVAGSNRQKIIVQFLGETLLIVFIAHIIAMILVELMLPGFNAIMGPGSNLKINYQSAGLYLLLITVVLFCGFLGGSYPAIYISSLKPSSILNDKYDHKGGKNQFRKILVIIQFTLSIIFILCTFIVRSQLNYIVNNELALNMDNMVHFELNEGMLRETLKTELEKIPDITSITATGHQNVLSNWAVATGLTWNGKKEGDVAEIGFMRTDMNFAKTFSLVLKKGQFLTENEYSSGVGSQIINVVINEKAENYFGFDNPIGEELYEESTGIRFKIIGVIKDFQFRGSRYNIEPLIILPINNQMVGGTYYVRIRPDKITPTLTAITNIFKTNQLDYTPDFKFLDDDLSMIYTVEQKAGKFLGIIAIITILLSCFGLLGLVSLITERRTKEIGIRKSNGAKSSEIFSLLSKDYIFLVLISFIIASPVAWFATNIWLRGFAYRTNVGWQIFLMTLIIILFFTVLTVGYQSYKAASKNPVDALRYE